MGSLVCRTTYSSHLPPACLQVALGKPFAAWLLPRIRQHFPDFPDRSVSDFYAAINVMKSPSLIRVEADEVTYPMHIILRYEIERGLMDGSIQVSQR